MSHVSLGFGRPGPDVGSAATPPSETRVSWVGGGWGVGELQDRAGPSPNPCIWVHMDLVSNRPGHSSSCAQGLARASGGAETRRQAPPPPPPSGLNDAIPGGP